VAHEHEPRGAPELVTDDPGGGVELLVVLLEVVDVVRRLVLAQAPAVLAQVERVEGSALAVPVLGEPALEEVVVPAVHVEQRARGPDRVGRRRPVAHEGRDVLALLVGREGDRPGLEALAEHVGDPALDRRGRLPWRRG